MNERPDYRSLGFVLTAGDVAEVLECTTAQTLDLLRAGDISALITSTAGPMTPLMFLFHPDEARHAQVRRTHDLVTADETVRGLVQQVLRDYLADVPPVEDYDVALETNAPLWGSSRNGRTLNVRTDAVLAYRRRTDGRVPVTTSGVEATLDRLGALRVRGLVPAATPGGKQRWGTWWRVPPSLLAGEDEDALAADLVYGVRDPDEEVRRRAGAHAVLAEPLGVTS